MKFRQRLRVHVSPGLNQNLVGPEVAARPRQTGPAAHQSAKK